MGQIADRFKGQDTPANWRFNPFTEADMAEDKTENGLTVPVATPFCIQLREVPRKNISSSVTVYCVEDGTNYLEVTGSPASGEFRVDYPSPDGYGTGLIEFNSSDQGKTMNISYKGTGSPVITEYHRARVPFPAGNPNNNQVVAFDSGVETWRYLKKCYFHEGNALYHPDGESKSAVLFKFKKSTYESKIYLELQGDEVWQGFYTELKDHNHGTSGFKVELAGKHYHEKGTLAGAQPKHFHLQDGTGGEPTTEDGDEAVTISGITEEKEDHDHPLSGNIDSEGGNPKTFPDQLKVYIDGVDKTANILTLSGLAKLGDGTESHAFVTTGTGEMNISSLISGDGFHEIKITEPASGKGGRCLLHLEVY